MGSLSVCVCVCRYHVDDSCEAVRDDCVRERLYGRAPEPRTPRCWCYRPVEKGLLRRYTCMLWYCGVHSYQSQPCPPGQQGLASPTQDAEGVALGWKEIFVSQRG